MNVQIHAPMHETVETLADKVQYIFVDTRLHPGNDLLYICIVQVVYRQLQAVGIHFSRHTRVQLFLPYLYMYADNIWLRDAHKQNSLDAL